MINSAGERLLNQFEAGGILQRYMPKKNVLQWLEKDRMSDPILRYSVVEGEVYYRPADLQHFVVQYIYPHAHIDFSERRMSERRAGRDRRRNPEVHLAPGIERRHRGEGDRRTRALSERRNTAAR